MESSRENFALGVALAVLLFGFGTSPANAAKGLPSPGFGERVPGNQMVRKHFVSGPEQCLRVTSAGIRLRNAGVGGVASGTIILPDGPTLGNVIWAGLYWLILSTDAPVNAVTLNGAPVTPVALPVSSDPCWGLGFSFPFFADVTGLVVAGANTIAGIDDSGAGLGEFPQTEGASLVVVYESDSFSGNACEIIVMDGNDLMDQCNEQIDNEIPVTCGSGYPAALTFIGGDGQGPPTYTTADDNHLWNFVALGDNDDFDASDPGTAGAAPDIAWDTDTWPVVTELPNVASINTLCTLGGDCVNWLATVLEVQVTACKPVSVDPETWGRTKSRYR